MSNMRWLPLESNPEVMNKYVHKLGVPEDATFVDVFDLEDLSSIPKTVLAALLLLPLKEYVHALGVSKDWEFTDVYGLDAELLMLVPQPVASVLLLYPLSAKTEKPSEQLGKVDQKAPVYYMKQTIGNACGTIGLIHALCNNAARLNFDADKHLSAFLSSTKDLPPEERGKHLESDTAFSEIHEESAQEGQTAAPSRDDKIDLHFIAFVHKNGKLYELDGRKDGPVCHGDSSDDTLLKDTAAVVKQFMARDPDNLNFTVVALSKP